MKIPVHVQTAEGVELPNYASVGSSGMDVRANEDVIIYPGQSVVVKTGLKVAIPEGYEIQVRPRSGVSLKTPLRIANAPGTIDSDYRDEIGIILYNGSDADSKTTACTVDTKGNIPGTYFVNKGDRIAQLVLQEVPQIEWIPVEDVKTIGEDRGGGFGHTGMK